MGRIVAIGMSNTDLVVRAPRLPLPGETLPGSTFGTFAGGKGANQAVAAARSGATVWFGGAVGDDSYGQERLSDLQAAGVDVSLVQVRQGSVSGVALIIVAEDGENQIVTVAGANYEVDPDALVARLGDLEPDLVMMTWDLHPDASRRIAASVPAGMPLIVNTAPFHDSLNEIFPDDRLIVVANEIEAGQILGRKVSIDAALEAAREIHARGCRAAVITIGAAGAVCVDAAGSWEVKPPQVKVVDTTGAGDAFCGAFAAWISAGASLPEAVTAGVHAGSLATTRSGAQASLPHRREIEESLAALVG